ncbi:PQQ-binding-like beta-propeller repeat protein (plasmid) [Haladaptatus sp. SPP-AMP-3]|uniref:PQQ-binding-like beta-propeller repeat protein n=1 Tax=Haladaptatus sp. SPP-AMP-3 TaxID=3121295 RepID=UPI003C2E36CF
MPSRRRFLALGATAALAGCATKADDPPKAGADESPDPEEHIHGANGEWSSFGCNASNTRTVADGNAPVDGVTERWRVDAPQLLFHAPVASDGRVFLPVPNRLEAYDARDGSMLWVTDEYEAETAPLVRDGTVYVGASNRLRVLDAKTGTTKWERTFDADGTVEAPSTYGGDWLYVPVGETVYRVDSETGEVDWSRRLFGTLLGSPPCGSAGVTLATEAGKVYVFGPDGTGWGEWNLPPQPHAPPTIDTDGIYVNCLDGKTYGIRTENEPRLDVDWSVETGWVNGGLAVKENLYAAGTKGLRAIDPATGEQLWTEDTGDQRRTTPALVRDTLFVGGEKLFAFDPTPSSGLLSGDGPARRFEKSFYGPVRFGPVLNDGALYAVAQTGEETYQLVALE